MDIALVTCRRLAGLDVDDEPLARALEQEGLGWRAISWDDEAVDWRDFRAILIRSPWDYHLRRVEFLGWAERAAAATALFNPHPLVAWNTHKGYLADLERQGVPVAPTAHFSAGATVDFGALLRARGWTSAVIKPAVSAGSFATVRAAEGDPAGQAHLDAHLPSRDMMVQAYLPTVREPGERSLVFFDGQLSHAVRREAFFEGQTRTGHEMSPAPAAPDEIALARRVLALVSARAELGGRPPLYARVDLLRDEQGAPLLMELELIEPSLFLRSTPGAATALARALAARVRPR